MVTGIKAFDIVDLHQLASYKRTDNVKYLKKKSTYIMKDHKDTASSLRRQGIRLLSDEKLAAIKHYEDNLHRVVCITNTLILLVKVAAREKVSRKRRHLSCKSREQPKNPKKRRKLDTTAQDNKDVFKQEVDDLFKDLLTQPSNR